MQSDPQLPNVGDLLDRGKYRIDAVIGEGGMGVVFAATHMQMGSRRRAIKWLLPKLARDEGAVKRFLAEANIAARIDHPNVVSPIDVSVDTGAPYIVMELLEGEALSEYLSNQPLSVDETGRIFMPILDGVAAAHDQNIVHRDLKPANIFLVRSGVGGRIPKVLDFGIAKVLDGRQTHGTLTDHGALLGTLQYMSPEQLSDASSVGPQTDVYALGVILYRMLSGKLPFEGNLLDLALRIRDGRPTPLGTHAPAIPEALASAVMRALASSLEVRYRDVRLFAAALAPFFPQSSQPPGPATGRSISGFPPAAEAVEPALVVGHSRTPAAESSVAPILGSSISGRENSTFHPITMRAAVYKGSRMWLAGAAVAVLVGVAGMISLLGPDRAPGGAPAATVPGQSARRQNGEPRAAAGQPVNPAASTAQPDAGVAVAPPSGWADLGGVQQPSVAPVSVGTVATDVAAPPRTAPEVVRAGTHPDEANRGSLTRSAKPSRRSATAAAPEKPKANPLDTILGHPAKVLDTILDSTPTER